MLMLIRHDTLVVEAHQVGMAVEDELFDGRHIGGLIGHQRGVLFDIEQQSGVDLVDDLAHHPRLVLMLIKQKRHHVAPHMIGKPQRAVNELVVSRFTAFLLFPNPIEGEEQFRGGEQGAD